MNKKQISFSFIIIVLLSLVGHYNYFQQIWNEERDTTLNLKNSGFWNENDFNFIHIDNNWSSSEAAYDWIQWDSTFSKYIIENVSLDCTGNTFGILIENSNTWDFEIRNCTIYNANSYAIGIYNTDSGIIEDCELYNNDNAIRIESGSNAIVVQDCNIHDNNDYSIYLSSSSFNTVRWSNITSNYGGVILYYSDSYNVLENNISNNDGNGLQFTGCNNCDIEDNTISYNTGAGYVNGGGIYWDGGSNNAILRNNISHNRAGVYFTGTSGTNFLGINNNNVKFNSRAGISVLDGSFANTVNIRNNNITGNGDRGIQIFWAEHTTIDENIVENNGDHGIIVAVDHDTMVSDNFISNNDGYGIYHPDEYSPRRNLEFYNNTVSGNTNYNIYITSFDDHATYPGSFTYNTIIGNAAIDERTSVYNANSWNYNYFSYYSGEDANDDGYGDTAQTLYNPTITIQDQNPRWWDSPLITIISPSTDDYINTTAPEITYDISRGIADTVWYNLDDGLTQTQNYTYLSSIDQSVWDLMNDGDVWIHLYVNDSKGWENSNVVKVIKDSIGRPQISILGVNEGDIFGKSAPSGISIFTSDPDGIDDIWYRLENSTHITDNSTWLGYIEQNIWDLISNGSLIITIYANDTLGHIGTKKAVVWKDIFPPNIQINDPSPMELVGLNAPIVSVSFSDINSISERWYSLYNATYSTSNNTWTGSIDPLIWNEIGNGTVILKIWANDTLNNVGFNEVILRKDILAPYISVVTPLNGEIINGTAPEFSLIVNESNLDNVWYSLDNDLTNISCGLTGIIDQSTWSVLPDGPITLKFYANDTLDNTRTITISLRKDTIPPQINIISPTSNQNFPLEAPEFTIEIVEVNLDTLWYTLDGGLTNITFTSNQTIDQTEWMAQSDGIIELVFYANDTFGRINSSSISIIKDSIVPTINLITPTEGEAFGEAAPNFTVNIYDANLDVMWYTLDGGVTNITFTANGTIDQDEWTAHSDGIVNLTFYARDFAGNEFNYQIDINKDTTSPYITIISPLMDEYFSGPPTYNINITEPNLDSFWYTIDGGVTNASLSELSGTLDASEWFTALDGLITIRFYANDSFSNENFAEITIYKDSTSPIITIIAPEDNQEFLDDAPGYLIEIDEFHLESYWYSLDGGVTNITITELSGPISESAWDSLPNGQVTITFYARDELGNIGQNSIMITKNSQGSTPPPGIPGYDLSLVIGVISVISIMMIRKRLKS